MHRHGIVKRGKRKVGSCGVSLGYRMVKKRVATERLRADLLGQGNDQMSRVMAWRLIDYV